MDNDPPDNLPDEVNLIQSDRKLVLVTCLLLTIFACAGIAMLFWADNRQLSIGVAYASAAAAIAFFLFQTRLIDFITTAVSLLIIVFYAIHFMSYTSAPDDIGVYWYYATILGAFFFLGARGGIIYSLFCIVGILLLHFHAPTHRDIGPAQLTIMTASILVTGVVALFYEIAVSKRTLALTDALSQVRHLATTDYLTGVINRRNFIDQGKTQFEQPGPLTAITMDIDNFKQCNDTYGHAAGDKVLCAVVNVVKRHLRQNDIFGRIGGEEFAILLPVEISIGKSRAEELRRAIAALNCRVDDLPVATTVSMGVAGRSAADTSLEVLLSRADQALYDAKRKGKNRVTAAETVYA